MLDMADAMSDTNYARADVTEALEAVYAVYAAVDEALELDSVTLQSLNVPGSDFNLVKKYDITFDPSGEKSNGSIGSNGNLTNDGGTITKLVADDGFFRRLPTNTIVGRYCGHVVAEYIPDNYAKITTTLGNGDIIKITGYDVAEEFNSSNPYPCMQTNFTAKMPGTTTVEIEYYVNYHVQRESGNCNFCGRCTTIPSDNTWHKYKDTFNVTVNADYKLIFDANGGTVDPTIQTKRVADTEATFNNLPTPTRTDYTFLGWAESANGRAKYKANPTDAEKAAGIKDTVTLYWATDGIGKNPGSQGNPVTKTLYAVWEKVEPTTYTVTYTDGVDGEIVFADQGYEGLKVGDHTPAFEMADKGTETVIVDEREVVQPKREGYTFTGWELMTTTDPTHKGVQEKVQAVDADSRNEIVYTAQWKEIPTHTVTYTWSGLPEGTTDPAVPETKSYTQDAEVTVDKREKDSTVRVDDKTYVFSGWSTKDAIVTDRKFEMPAKNVVIEGKWTEKQYTVEYKWTGLPAEATEKLPDGGTYYEGFDVEVDKEYTSATEITVGEGENAETYIFSGWSTSNAVITDGTFSMPGNNVTISGAWTKKEETPPPL